MNWLPSFFAPAAAWFFLLAIPVVVFYFLKLKRTRMAVPSLVLWQQVLQDQRVNSPFQRFKRNILLFLQLLLLCLLVLAAMGPYFRGEATGAERLLVMIDQSASMAALDAEGGESRADAARKQVREMIDNLSPSEEMAVVAFDRTARQLASFTSNKRILRAAVDEVDPVDAASDLGDALRMAEAMGRTEPFDRAILITDGNVPAQVDFDLPFELEYRKLDPGGANLGLTALSAQRATGGGWHVFTNVQSNGPAVGATLELHQDGKKIATEDLVVDVGQGRRIPFKIAGDRPTAIELRLVPTGFDALPADNRAYLRLGPSRSLVVYCEPTLETWHRALSVMDGVRLVGSGELNGSVDLAITDLAREDIEATVSLRVGYIPDELRDTIKRGTGDDTGGGVIDWQRDHPLFEYIQFGDVVIADRLQWTGEAREDVLEDKGYEVVMYGTKGPMALQRVTPTRADYWLLFHTDRSTLPYRVGFPILVSNIVKVALHRANLLERGGDRTGVLPPIEAPAGSTIDVLGPGGQSQSVLADERGIVTGVAAPRAGWYTVTGPDGSESSRIGVSLLQPSETSLKGVDTLDLGESGIESNLQPAKTNRALWSVLAMVGLVVLCVEWWYFQRRPGGQPA